MNPDWTVWDYELDMFNALLPEFHSADFSQYPLRVRNAVVESFLLHTRQLADILRSSDHGDGDDVKLDKLLTGFTPPHLDEFKRSYGRRDDPDSPRYIINKRLMHPTNIRTDSFNYTEMVEKKLRVVMQLCFDEVETERISRGEGQMKRSESWLLTLVNLSTSSR